MGKRFGGFGGRANFPQAMPLEKPTGAVYQLTVVGFNVVAAGGLYTGLNALPNRPRIQ
ncbi:hypothetical protein [Phyllobacterium brassicacearum]|uniref:hypothetical protein n=1 Tax=Phyllobacterium brassicacearum TaxID=314235 RepID=UPI0010E1DFB7|nr:hypothetical protein [Phyllobacterium brassicacearum]TDQ16692.1 hypothetical protein DEV91_13215 [Phyllobacterium brassicacearum]